MTHIGKVIKEFRCKRGISRKELSEDICSEQYVYLIEKGERTPSVELSAQFSSKLGIDLFEYCYYLSGKDPVAVYEFVKKMDELRRNMNYEELTKVTEEALELEDFYQEPWSYEIELNRLSYKVFVEQKWKETIVEIKKIFKEVKLKNETEKYYVNLYVLLSTCYQMGRDFKNAETSSLAAEKVIRNKVNNRNYKQEITTVNLNLMTMYYYQGKYDESIKIGLRQIEFHSQMDSCQLAHYTSFYLSYAYFEKGLEEEAFKWFERGLSHINTSEKYLDAYYISTFKSFHKMIINKRAKKEQVKDFLNKFKIYEFHDNAKISKNP